MKTKNRVLAAVFAALIVASAAYSQATPRTLDAVEEVGQDGATTLNIQMTFDAQPWVAWKAMIGDQPSRLRASFQHQFAALAIEDFKVDRDDMNRTARVSLRSPSGPEIRKDGSFRIPVEKEFRLVNSSGRDWFFSGNNPYAGNSLNTLKIVLPPNLVRAELVNAGTSDQALNYTVKVAPGPSRILILSGAVLLGAGTILSIIGFLLGRDTVRSVTGMPPPVSTMPGAL